MIIQKIVLFLKRLILISIINPLTILGASEVPVASVSEFLKDLKNSLALNVENQDTIFHVILGNQSADLDSLCAAIARARTLSLGSKNPNCVYYPVINIIRPELKLRRDAQLLFKNLGIDEEDLLFVNELPLEELRKQGRLFVHLVDHNALVERQKKLQNCVVSIIDHHDDKKIKYPMCPKKNQIIRTVGSVSSLIAPIFFSVEPQAHSSWAELLLAPVTLDTKNLQDEKKTTIHDVEAHKLLRTKIPSFNVEVFHSELLYARQNVAGFTPEMLLCKDQKAYVDQHKRRYVVSSLPRGCNRDWCIDPDYLEALQKLQKNSASALVSSLEKGDERKIFHVLCNSQEQLEALRTHLQSKEVSLKSVTEIETNSELPAATFKLPAECGRKQLQPILERFMNSEESYS